YRGHVRGGVEGELRLGWGVDDRQEQVIASTFRYESRFRCRISHRHVTHGYMTCLRMSCNISLYETTCLDATRRIVARTHDHRRRRLRSSVSITILFCSVKTLVQATSPRTLRLELAIVLWKYTAFAKARKAASLTWCRSSSMWRISGSF